MKRSKLLLLLVAILISNFSLFAQNDSLSYKNQLQFHLIDGYSLSYLNLFSPSSGIRFKIDLNFRGSSGSSDVTQNYFYNNSNNQSKDQQKIKENWSSSSQYFNLAVNYIWISNISKEINLYLGIGPLISYSRNYSNDDDKTTLTTPNSNSESIYESTSSSFGLGVQGVIGVECNITEKISLLAEFNLNGTYSWNHWLYDYENQSTGSNRTENTEDGSSWNYELNNLKVGIAYRF